MFPYKDDNPTLATPVVTLLLIGLNVASEEVPGPVDAAEPDAR